MYGMVYLLALCVGLGSDDFKTRERCSKELTQLNNLHDLRPVVEKLARSSDPEVKRRAKDILAAYRAVYPDLEEQPGLDYFPRWLQPAAYDAAMKAHGFDVKNYPWLKPGDLPGWWSGEQWRDARTTYLGELLDRGWRRQTVQLLVCAASIHKEAIDTLAWMKSFTKPRPLFQFGGL